MQKSILLFFILIFGLGSDILSADSKKDIPKKNRRYINLIVGLDEHVKMPYMPKRPRFKGNYKTFTKLSYSKELKTLLFSPKKAGSATITIQDHRDRIISELFLTIRQSKLNTVAKEIQLLLNDIDGIKVRIINNKVIVDGQVLLPKELSRIHDVVSQYGGQAANIVTLSLVAQKKIAEFIERDINNPQIHVRSVNGKFLIEGVANNETEKQRAEIIAKTYVPDMAIDRGAGKGGVIKKVKVKYVINLLTIKPPERPEPQPEKIIQLVVHFVELNKDYQKGFQFDFTPQMEDTASIEFSATRSSRQGTPAGVVAAITGTISNLLPKLNWAKQHGYARVLQSASVIVKNGVEGRIESITKIPYQTVGQGGVTGTEFINAGITSAITPTMVGPRSDSINLVVSFTVSNPVNEGRIFERKIDTQVVIRSRQSAAIGGLVSQHSSTGFNKRPRGHENPLISLFASKDFQRAQSQFVVFITPVIKSSASAGAERIKSKFRLRN